MKFKKVIGMLLAGVMLISTVPVFAAETGDEPFSKYTCDGGYEEKISYRKKTNTTKVYTKVSTSPQYTMQVRVYGYLNGSYINKTNGGVAYVTRGTNSSISNGIYEAGYRYASMAFRCTGGENYYGYTSGVWSPDSTKNYEVVN